MHPLFEPYQIADLTIRNRFMRSPTTSYYSDDDGVLRDPIIDYYDELSSGGVGLIVKGHLYVLESGKVHIGQAGISHDKHISRLKELTSVVHRNNGAIIAQISFGGARSSVVERVAPSEYSEEDWVARALTEDEIGGIIEAFGNAAGRVMQAGFDGVQIHGAHGYLISEFLSRHVNKRSDKWGGSLKNRMRLLLEVYRVVRERVGNSLVGLKMNSDDFTKNGFMIEDSMKVAETICSHGLDLLEISGNGLGMDEQYYARALHKDPALKELGFAGHAERIREVTRPIPMALVQGFTRLSTMKAVIERGIADLVSMSRPLIREPDLVNSLQAGQDEATCIRCNKCSGEEVFGKTMLKCQLD
jgi:2,4-dienoyl-CoA reductase-like NADH-dependent reductase (Old Yellow Enzyme family)